jgi:hypothetical protein
MRLIRKCKVISVTFVSHIINTEEVELQAAPRDGQIGPDSRSLSLIDRDILHLESNFDLYLFFALKSNEMV